MRDIADYIAACFWAAIGFRGKVSAVVGIVSGLLALPIVWLFGGSLEWSSHALVYVPLWLTASSTIAILVIAPFFVWLEQQAKLQTSSLSYDPINYVELAGIAAKDLGWDFASRFQDRDFRDCIQAGCNSGAIAMEAIQIDAYTEEHRRTQYLPTEVPKTSWRERHFRIWRLDDVGQTLPNFDNWHVYVGTMFGKRIGNFRDPRLTRKADAISWVRLQGPKYRGQNELGEAKQAERRRLIEQDLEREAGADKS